MTSLARDRERRQPAPHRAAFRELEDVILGQHLDEAVRCGIGVGREVRKALNAGNHGLLQVT